MKKRLSIYTLAVALIMVISATFTGCLFNREAWNSMLPTEHYYATMTYKNWYETSEFTHHYEVAYKTQVILGETHEVTYLKWWQEDENGDYDYGYEYLELDNDENKVLMVNSDGNAWVKQAMTFTYDTFKYKMWTSTDSFWYRMTRPVQGRIFRKNKVTYTDEYILVKETKPDEEFHIANNDYHYLLFYHIETSISGNDLRANVELGEPEFVIPYLDTITAETITWE